MWIDQKDEIKYGVYGPSKNDFGKVWGKIPKTGPKLVDDWISCREVFHNEWKPRNRVRFYYCHSLPKGSGRSISVFFDKVEDRLNLPIEQRSKFGPTNKRKILWIEPSNWWCCHAMRRSLFTALLRHAINYRIHLDNFDESLYVGPYLEDTKEALDRFLSGSAYYWGNEIGWMNAFDKKHYWNKNLNINVKLRDYPKPVPTRKTKKKADQLQVA
jgi:hypothetical protein